MDEILKDCVYSGFMFKLESGKFKKDGEKFLRLYRNGILCFFRNEKKKSFCIKIESYPTSIIISAENEETMSKWAKYFESVGGIGCKNEVYLDRQSPLLTLQKWKKETVEAWLSCSYFLDGRSFYPILQEYFFRGKKMIVKNLRNVDSSFFETSDTNEKKLEKPDFHEIMNRFGALQRRNVFDFGENVVLKKILNVVSHIPTKSKQNLDFQYLARALSNPDAMIETYFNLFIQEVDIDQILKKGKKRKRLSPFYTRVKKPAFRGEVMRMDGRSNPRSPINSSDGGGGDEDEVYEEKISRGDYFVIPIVMFFFEDLEFSEWKSVKEIFSPVISDVPQLPKTFSGNIKPALFVGPWMLTWEECGLVIPRRLSNIGCTMYKYAIDLSLSQRKICRKVENLTYREIVSRLAKLCCRWNRKKLNVHQFRSRHVTSARKKTAPPVLPNYSHKALFEDNSPGLWKKSGGMNEKHGGSKISSLGASEYSQSNSFDSVSSNKDYEYGDSIVFASEIFDALGSEDNWKFLLDNTIGPEKVAPEMRMEFDPNAAGEEGEEFIRVFKGKTEKLGDLGARPLSFDNHKELDEFVHDLSISDHIKFTMDFQIIKMLLLLFDRLFWLRHLNDPSDERFRPRQDIRTSTSVKRGCILNSPDFRIREFSTLQELRGLVDFAEAIDWEDPNAVKNEIQRDGMKLRFARKGLNNVKSLVKIAVKQNAIAMKYASKKLQGDSELLRIAVAQDGLTIRYASIQFMENERKNRSVFEEAVKQNGEALKYLSSKLRENKKIVKAAVKQKGTSISFASDALKNNKEIALCAVTSDPEAFHHISEILKKDREIVLEVVKKDYRFLVEHVVPGLGFQTDYTIVNAFLDGVFERFSSLLYQDLRERFQDELVTKVYEAKRNGLLLINIPHESSYNSQNTIYIGFSKDGVVPDGFGFELKKVSRKMQKKHKKKKPNYVIDNYEKSFVGEFSNGLRSGKGMDYYDNRMEFEGVYKNNVRNGRGVFYDLKTGIIQNGVWKNGGLDHVRGGFKYKIIPHSEVKKYLVDSNRIGKGGVGSVYRVPSSIFKSHFKIEEKKVAVKVIETVRGPQDELTFRMTKRGIELIYSVPDRENIVEIYSIIRGVNCCGYVMKLCHVSIDKLIKDAKKKVISLDEKIRMLYETAKGMRSLHSRDVMHRDLKWGNVMIDFDGTIKLTDFDTLKEDESFRLYSLQQSFGIGTVGYICPEVYHGKRITLKCDVFAYGLMIYALLWEMNFPYRSQFQCSCGTTMKSLSQSTPPFKHLDKHVAEHNFRPLLIPKEVEMFPSFLIDLVVQCWDKTPFNRPSFDDICLRFELEEKKDNCCTIKLRFTKHEGVKEQKLLITKPYRLCKIISWIEKKFNKNIFSSTGDDEEEIEGEKEEEEEVNTNVVSLTHSILGTVYNDIDLKKVLDMEQEPSLDVELNYIDKEYVFYGLVEKQKQSDDENRKNVELEKRLEEKENEVERLKRELQLIKEAHQKGK